MARWHKQELFPEPLREFVEAEWPPVEGECLGGYTCRGGGYAEECRPREFQVCGERTFQNLRDTYPAAQAELMIAAWRRADAAHRFHQARLSWIGSGGEGWLAEFIAGHHHEHELRYSYVPPREIPTAS